MDKKDLYIKLVNGDITPLVRLRNQAATWQNIYTPYLCEQFKYYEPLDKIITLDDITPNLSKYIPEDNAVLFLSEQDMEKYDKYFPNIARFSFTENDDGFYKRCSESGNRIYYNKLTIFLPHGTEAEIQKAEEVGKYLWENFRIKPNLCVLHWFKSYWRDSIFHPKNIDNLRQAFGSDFTQDTKLNGFSDIQIKDYEYLNDCRTKWEAYFCNFNKIITTNSTGILPVQDKERLQVIDCKKIFEEYLNENNLI